MSKSKTISYSILVLITLSLIGIWYLKHEPSHPLFPKSGEKAAYDFELIFKTSAVTTSNTASATRHNIDTNVALFGKLNVEITNSSVGSEFLDVSFNFEDVSGSYIRLGEEVEYKRFFSDNIFAQISKTGELENIFIPMSFSGEQLTLLNLFLESFHLDLSNWNKKDTIFVNQNEDTQIYNWKAGYKIIQKAPASFEIEKEVNQILRGNKGVIRSIRTSQNSAFLPNSSTFSIISNQSINDQQEIETTAEVRVKKSVEDPKRANRDPIANNPPKRGTYKHAYPVAQHRIAALAKHTTKVDPQTLVDESILETVKQVPDFEIEAYVKIRDYLIAFPEEAKFFGDKLFNYEYDSDGMKVITLALVDSQTIQAQNVILGLLESDLSIDKRRILLETSQNFLLPSKKLIDAYLDFDPETDDLAAGKFIAAGNLIAKTTGEDHVYFMEKILSIAKNENNTLPKPAIISALGNTESENVREYLLSQLKSDKPGEIAISLYSLYLIDTPELSDFQIYKNHINHEDTYVRQNVTQIFEMSDPSDEITNTLLERLAIESEWAVADNIVKYFLENDKDNDLFLKIVDTRAQRSEKISEEFKRTKHILNNRK